MKLDRNTKIVLLILTIFVAIVVGFYLYNKQFQPKYTWGKNYVHTNDQPYGTEILFKLLAAYNNQQLELIEKESAKKFLEERSTVTPATYFIIGNHANYEKDDMKAIENFVRNGNTVFMALEELSEEFVFELNSECNEIYYTSSESYNFTIPVNFKDKNLNESKSYKFFYEHLGKKEIQNWSYFPKTICSNRNSFEVLGLIKGKQINFIKLKVGKGQVLIHSNPLFFTNLHMIRPEAAAYAEKVFSYLPDGPIYWDQHSKIWSYTNTYSSNTDQSPFAYILNQASFKWAFYLLWSIIIIFLLFNLWRKQKAIPVILPKSNSTLEFIHTIGELYFSQKDNRKLALQKMELFLKNVRMKYHINENDEEKFIGLLSKKSEVPVKYIESMFNKYNTYKKSNVELSDEGLIQFYKLLESFHKKSK